MCMGVPCACVCRLCLQKTQEGIGPLEIGVTDGCDLTWEFWELNLGPLEEQQVLLTTEPSHQPHNLTLLNHFWEAEVGILSEITHRIIVLVIISWLDLF